MKNNDSLKDHQTAEEKESASKMSSGVNLEQNTRNKLNCWFNSNIN